MRTIGITGGVGAGKSLILNYIKEHYRAKIYMADEIAHFLKEPGQSCYQPLVDLLGEGILEPDGTINRGRMAEKIFADKALLEQVNEMIHPAVKAFILSEIEKERKKGQADFFILEAALLIEERYDEILDELWYIRADESVRRRRLREARNYSEERTAGIMKSQLSDEYFKMHCSVIIDNNQDAMDAYKQIDAILGEYISEDNKQ